MCRAVKLLVLGARITMEVTRNLLERFNYVVRTYSNMDMCRADSRQLFTNKAVAKREAGAEGREPKSV